MSFIETQFDLIVIGGGASGLMAAGRAAERGKRVLLLEKNKRLGEKLRISGGGRCNVTNAEFDERILLRAYGRAEQFLYSLFAQFGVKDTFSFFESKGLPLIRTTKSWFIWRQPTGAHFISRNWFKAVKLLWRNRDSHAP
ncbi:MAG: FAD-dependent oxidoreductase [bacterium]|nr:FAD-dependent oxidoreductase [bacterium]MDZ4286080.1 FAD-dependent oxidoreductase [Candidatus Sungbacteria bacterium]